jgi:hypothetical protein
MLIVTHLTGVWITPLRACACAHVTTKSKFVSDASLPIPGYSSLPTPGCTGSLGVEYSPSLEIGPKRHRPGAYQEA